MRKEKNEMAVHKTLNDIRNSNGEPVMVFVYAQKISRLSCTREGKHYFYVSVTDGKESACFPLFDDRFQDAKERFEERVVNITVKGSGNNAHISKIAVCEDATSEVFGDDLEIKEAPDRLRLTDLDMEKEVYACLPLLVTDVEEKKTKAGKPYCILRVTDGQQEESVYVWDKDTEEVRNEYKGKILNLTLMTGQYPKLVQAIPCEEYPASEFVKSAPVDPVSMYNEITELLSSDLMEGCSMAKVALKLYEDNKEKLLSWPGALKMHHSMYGGLLFHTHRMLQAAVSIGQVYDLDKPLLLVGVILHDIGKLQELDADDMGIATFTSDGNLSGHILLGLEMIDAAVWSMKEKPDPEELRLVKHMVASHHGELEYGSPVIPATPEAMVLHYLDMVDSRIEIFENAISSVAPGTVSDPVYALKNHRVYRRKDPISEERQPQA